MPDLTFSIKVRDDGSAVIEKFSGKTGKSFKGFGKSARGANRSLGGFRTGLRLLPGLAIGVSGAMAGTTLAFAALVKGLKGALTSFADFEISLKRVQLFTGATGVEFDRLQALAQQLGLETVFTATEAAKAMQLLAKAGLDAVEVQAALPGVLDLAAAAQVDVAKATDIALSALKGFGLGITEISRVSDVLLNASIATRTDVTQLGQAFSFVAAPARILGISIEETAAFLGQLADRGQKAGRAGRGLQALLTKLADPVGKLGDAFQSANIELRDADGQFIGLAESINRIRDSTLDATKFTSLFGRQAGRILSVAVGGSADELDKLIVRVNESGTAARVARELMNTLSGSFARLKAAFEGVALSIGQRLAPSFRDLIDGVIAFITPFATALNAMSLGIKRANESSTAFRGLGDVFASLAPSASALVEVFFFIRQSIGEVRIAFLLLGQLVRVFIDANVDLGINAKAAFTLVVSSANVAVSAVSKLISGLIKDLAAGTKAMLQFAAPLELLGGPFVGLTEKIAGASDALDGMAKSIDGVVLTQKELEEETATIDKAFATLTMRSRFVSDEMKRLEEAIQSEDRALNQNEISLIRSREALAELGRQADETRRSLEKLKGASQINVTVDAVELALQDFLINKTKDDIGSLSKAVNLAFTQQIGPLLKRQTPAAADAIFLLSAAFSAVGQNAGTLTGDLRKELQAIVTDTSLTVGQLTEKLLEFNQKLVQQREQRLRQTVQATANLFGSLASLSETAGAKSFKTTQKFQIAEAITSGALAVQRTFASLPFPANAIAAAAVAIQVAANIRRIRSASPGGGGGGAVGGAGGAPSPAVAAPIAPLAAAPAGGGPTTITISIAGFVGDEARLASELAALIREAEGDEVSFVAT